MASSLSRFSLRPVDVLLVAALAGGSYTLLAGRSGAGVRMDEPYALLRAAGGALLGLLSLAALYFSYSKALWISDYHLTTQERELGGVTAVRHVRKVGRKLPCPYPDAWFAVSMSEELPPGSIRAVTVCGHNLVVFRPQLKKGDAAWPKPAVLDAYCPHLGAHLALGGGEVRGDCIRCPFHGWCFGPDGTLRSIPTADTPPTGPGTTVAAWPCLERNGVVSVWMNSRVHLPKFASDAGTKLSSSSCEHDGAPSAAAASPEKKQVGAAGRSVEQLEADTERAASVPHNEVWFEIPRFPQVDGRNRPFVYHGVTENIVNAVLFEIPENGSDICHLHVLHREFIIPALYPFLAHKWHGSWTEGKLEGTNGKTFNADICVDEQMLLMDYPLPGEVNVKITQCGPSQVYLDMQTPVGPVMIVETVTPVAPMQLRVLHALYAGPFVPRIVAKAILKSTVVQFEKDVPVWGNKKFMPSASGGAQLVAADSAIRNYRTWIRRFWDADKGSITFEQAAKQHAIDTMGLPSDVALAW